jgi:hypothetical protein
MTFVRAVFLFALLMLAVGDVLGRWLLSSAAGPGDEPGWHQVALAATSTAAPTATEVPTITPVVTQRLTTPTPMPTSTPTATPAATLTSVPTAQPTASPTVRSTATPSPAPSPTTGIVTLVRYWVGSPSARPGQTVAMGYVIDNATGHTVRVMLGASLKASASPNWVTGAISDPAHDVVAEVPPGTTTHERFFTLPRVKRGSYDVAWGLKDASTGGRVALVSAGSALQVR